MIAIAMFALGLLIGGMAGIAAMVLCIATADGDKAANDL